jgi:hypothetical protein
VSDAPDSPQTDEVRIRRAPKYPAFMIVGGGIGAIATYIVTSLFPVDPQVGFGALFGYFSLFGIPAGVVLGALLALILDRRASRRSKTVEVEREVVEPAAEPQSD